MKPALFLFGLLVVVVVAVALVWPIWSMVTEPATPGETSANVR